MGAIELSIGVKISILLVCGIGNVKAQCKSTGLNVEDVECPRGHVEVWRDLFEELTSKKCCDPKHEQYLDFVNMATGCRVTKCVPSTTSNSCASFLEREVKGERMNYEEVLREPCTRSLSWQERDNKVSEAGVVGLCCPYNSTEGMLASAFGAEPYEFPHQARLDIEGSQCGGTIYNKKFIITAAHCVVDTKRHRVQRSSRMNVFLGSNMGENESKEYIYKVNRVIAHKEYSKLEDNPELDKPFPRTYNDIALLELDRDIKFGPHVKALEIAPKNFNSTGYADKSVIVGWGTTDTLSVVNHLQRANFVIRPDTKCFSKKERARWSKMEGMEDQLLCVGGILEGKWSPTAGEGDSGGPAICRGSNGKAVLCGVTSFGGSDKTCAENDDEKNCPPSVYTEVAYYHDWIIKHAGYQDKDTLYQPYLYGEPVSKTKYPHQVHITNEEGKSCGGTLIKPNVVITAGHCTETKSKSYNGIKVKLISDLTEDGKEFGVEGVELLPGFKRIGKAVNVGKQGNRVRMTDNYYKNDLALIKLDTKVDISPSKLPELPDEEQILEYHYGTEVAFPREPYKSSKLMAREFKFLDRSDCQKRINRMSRLGFNIKVSKNLLCGVETYSGGSTCDRELGGGVICKNGRNKDVLCGVQVFRLCEFSIPNGFTNMALYKNWVSKTIQKFNA